MAAHKCLATVVVASLASNALAMETLAGFSDSVYAKTAVGLSVVLIVGFGVFALVYTFLKQRRDGKEMTNEDFVTARGSANKWLIAWSLYGSAVGSWVISATPSYAAWAGIIGNFFYAFAAGLPILVIGFLGNMVQEEYPQVLSLSDFINYRFGRITQVLVVFITLFNMAIASCAEYTTLTSIFGDYVGLGSYDILIAILVGLVTLTYTTVGGLGVSIQTDKVQATFSILLFFVVVIYVLATWRVPGGVYQPENLDQEIIDMSMGTTEQGYSSIFTMPLSLLTATVFSEAMWQRVWASESPSAVRFGSLLAAVMVFIVAFTIGFSGILLTWAGIYASNENLWLFYILQPYDAVFQPLVSSAVGVIVILFTVTMSESALDSMQNGIGGAVNGSIARYVPDHALLVSRIVVVVLNVPLIIVGSLKLNVISLFLVGNMVCTSAAFPVVLGLSKNKWIRKTLTDIVPPLAFLISVVCTVGYGTSDVPYDPNMSAGERLGEGIKLAFYSNGYAWDYFLVSFTTSIGATFLIMVINNFTCRRNFEPPTREVEVNNTPDNFSKVSQA